MAFDYQQPDVPSSAIADVVAEISNHGKPTPLSKEERHQRQIDQQIYLEQCRQRDEQWSLEYRQQQAAKLEAFQRQAAIAAQHAQRERRVQQDRDARERQRESEIANLRSQVKRHDWWQQEVERAATNAAAVQQRLTLFGQLDAMIAQQFAQPKAEPDE
jgi:hypothetical protein